MSPEARRATEVRKAGERTGSAQAQRTSAERLDALKRLLGDAVHYWLVKLGVGTWAGRLTSLEQVVTGLDPDCLYVMACEGSKESFGPYPHDHGKYGDLRWPVVRLKLAKLQHLGLVEVSREPGSGGQYRWTPRGRRILTALELELTRVRYRWKPE